MGCQVDKTERPLGGPGCVPHESFCWAEFRKAISSRGNNTPQIHSLPSMHCPVVVSRQTKISYNTLLVPREQEQSLAFPLGPPKHSLPLLPSAASAQEKPALFQLKGKTNKQTKTTIVLNLLYAAM